MEFPYAPTAHRIRFATESDGVNQSASKTSTSETLTSIVSHVTFHCPMRLTRLRMIQILKIGISHIQRRGGLDVFLHRDVVEWLVCQADK